MVDEKLSRIGKLLLKRRKELKKTQQEVADELGINQKTYSTYEDGTRKPKNETIFKLSQIFKIDRLMELYHPNSILSVINGSPKETLEKLNNEIDSYIRDEEYRPDIQTQIDLLTKLVMKIDSNLENNIDLTLTNNSFSHSILFRLAEQDGRELRKDPMDIFQASVETAKKHYNEIVHKNAVSRRKKTSLNAD